MKNLLRNLLAILAGLFIGGAVNMALIKMSPSIIAPPPGVDVSNAVSLAKSMPLFEPRHFIMPFLAHALGTLTGALAAWLVAGSYKSRLAYVIGVANLCGGVAACFMIPAPAWFMALDLVLAYLPMAWLGIRIGARLAPPASASIET